MHVLLVTTTLAVLALTACLDSQEGTVGAADSAVADVPVADTQDSVTADDTAQTDAADDTLASDTRVDDTLASDTRVDDTTVASDPCVGPLRLSPRQGPSAGGTGVVVEGMEFYIGALTWLMKIGDAPATPMLYGDGVPSGPCRISFRTEPHTAGTYDARVYYGWGEPSEPSQFGDGIAGKFTYE